MLVTKIVSIEQIEFNFLKISFLTSISSKTASIIKSLSTIEVNKIVGKIEDERLVEQTIKTLKEELVNLDNQKTQHIGEIDEFKIGTVKRSNGYMKKITQKRLFENE